MVCRALFVVSLQTGSKRQEILNWGEGKRSEMGGGAQKSGKINVNNVSIFFYWGIETKYLSLVLIFETFLFLFLGVGGGCQCQPETQK